MTVIEEDMGGPNEDAESHHQEDQKIPEKKIKNLKKQKTANRKQRQRLGLLGAGSKHIAQIESLFYLPVFYIFSRVFFN